MSVYRHRSAGFRSNGWSLGVAGLIVVAVEAVAILLPAVLRGRYDVFY